MAREEGGAKTARDFQTHAPLCLGYGALHVFPLPHARREHDSDLQLLGCDRGQVLPPHRPRGDVLRRVAPRVPRSGVGRCRGLLRWDPSRARRAPRRGLLRVHQGVGAAQPGRGAHWLREAVQVSVHVHLHAAQQHAVGLPHGVHSRALRTPRRRLRHRPRLDRHGVGAPRRHAPQAARHPCGHAAARPVRAICAPRSSLRLSPVSTRTLTPHSFAACLYGILFSVTFRS